jgi:tetratricopeptide (TPR) repeat protein
MITDSQVAPPGECAAPAPAEIGDSPRPRGGRLPRRFGRPATNIAEIGVIAAIVAFNAWWYWRDTRPQVDPGTIDGWIARGEWARAEAAARERLRRSPHDGAMRMTLARILAGRGDLLDCARELAEVPYWWPERAEAQLRAAQALLTADHAREAEAVLQAFLDADPLHPPDRALYHDASQELLKLYATEDRWEDAYAVIWKAYDHAVPVDHPVILTMRIRCEIERMAPTETLKTLRRYVAADPADFEALRSMANAELAIGQGAAALRDMEACIKGRPEDARTWRDYLSMLKTLGEQDAFQAAMARLPRSADTEPEIWMLRGHIKERADDWAAAVAAYRRALELNPHLLNGHYRLATLEARLGHREQAAAHRKRWNELREARAQLRQVHAEYSAAVHAAAGLEPIPSARADLRAAARRLGTVCEALGWARVVDACNQIAASP